MLAQQLHECGREEALVPDLNDMPQCFPVEPRRQQGEEGGKIISIKGFRGRELPKDRSELGAQFHNAARDSEIPR